MARVPGQSYGTDLAYIQSAGFADFARGAAPGLLAGLKRAGIRGGPVVDLGCGAGVWLSELIEAGYDAVGIDSSPALIALARKAAPQARLHLGSLHERSFPKCVAVTAIGEALSYLSPDERETPSLDRLFRRVAAALAPGGLFTFDVLVGPPRRPMSYRTWRSGEGWAVLSDVSEDVRRRRLTREITSFVARGRSYRRADERHVLRVVRRVEIEAGLRAAGFSVRAARRYGRFALPPRRLAFKARKL